MKASNETKWQLRAILHLHWEISISPRKCTSSKLSTKCTLKSTSSICIRCFKMEYPSSWIRKIVTNLFMHMYQIRVIYKVPQFHKQLHFIIISIPYVCVHAQYHNKFTNVSPQGSNISSQRSSQMCWTMHGNLEGK